MKKTTLWVSLLALGLTTGLVQFTPTLHAQSQSQPPSAQPQPEQKQSRTFVGQIVQAKNGQYALLVDKSAGTGFYLDNSDKAKKYSGQNVKVTGTLDAQSKTIHISDIQPMA
jgi:hypothetical protein